MTKKRSRLRGLTWVSEASMKVRNGFKSTYVAKLTLTWKTKWVLDLMSQATLASGGENDKVLCQRNTERTQGTEHVMLHVNVPGGSVNVQVSLVKSST